MTYIAVVPTPSQASARSSQITPPDAQITQSNSVASRLSALSRIQQKPHNRHKRLGKYILGQTIGEGEFGKVKLAWAEGENGERRQYAIKLLRQDRLRGVDQAQRDKVNHEINALQACRHPHVIRLEDLLQNVHYIGIVLDFASGGDMFAYIYKNGRLEERNAQRLFAQLVSGVHYLHQKGIVHRDLKLENLLLDGNNKILISDFGFANSFRNSKGYTLMRTSCGSPCYAAPEVVNSDKNYDGRKVDVWSVGVILFTFLAGYLPFDDDPNNPDSEDIQQLYRYIATKPLKFPEWIGGEARDLLRQILVVEPERRAKMQEIMAHRWLADHRPFLSITPAEHEGSAPWQRRASAAPSQQPAPAPMPPVKPQSIPNASQLARSASVAAATKSKPSEETSSTASSASSNHGRRTHVPMGSSPMIPGSIHTQDVKVTRRQSASPAVSYAPATHHRTVSTMEEVPELGIATPPLPPSQRASQRLAPTSKPRPISFQPKTASSFELVDGSSLYLPKTSKPRVALNRESSKTGEMSRPLSYVSGHESAFGGLERHQAQRSGQDPQKMLTSSHARRYSAMPTMMMAATASNIPRSTSLKYIGKESDHCFGTMPSPSTDSSAIFKSETSRNSDVAQPTRRTSVRASTVATERQPGMPSNPFFDVSEVHRESNDSSRINDTPSLPQSRSKFRLSSALWPRRQTSAVTEGINVPGRRASNFPTQVQSQSNAAAAAALNNHRSSGIPVKSSNEPLNFKKKTLNFLKRRSMIG